MSRPCGDKLVIRLVKAYVAVMADSENPKVDSAEALDFLIIRTALRIGVGHLAVGDIYIRLVYVNMIKEMTKDLPNVTVGSFDGLLVDYMNQIDATIIVRGLRAVTDFEYELQIAQSNHVQSPHIETIFLTTNLNYSYLSSTIVKEFASYGGDISKFVPEQFIDRIYAKYNISR